MSINASGVSSDMQNDVCGHQTSKGSNDCHSSLYIVFIQSWAIFVAVPVFFCSVLFIMFQATVTTTNASVTGVSSSMLTTTMPVTMAPTYTELAAAFGRHEVGLALPLLLRDTIRGIVGLTTVQQHQP